MAIETIESLRVVSQWIPQMPGAWIALDIDDTLLRSPRFEGSEKWYEGLIEERVAQGEDRISATHAANGEWEALHLTLQPLLVDKKSPEWITEWRQKEFRVLGLTARAPRFAPRTKEQLTALRLSLHQENLNLVMDEVTQLIEGILYVGPLGNKSEALMKLFPLWGTPPALIFIDDKRSHLEKMEKALEKVNLPFRGGWIKR